MNPMRNGMKVAKWEIKRNLKNKTFLISIFLTPALIILFSFFGSMFSNSEDTGQVKVHVNDQAGVLNAVQQTAKDQKLDWKVKQTKVAEKEAAKRIKDAEETAYIFIDQQAIEKGIIPVYVSEDIEDTFAAEARGALEGTLKAVQLQKAGLTNAQLSTVSTPIQFKEIAAGNDDAAKEDFMQKLIPGVFGGLILFSISFSGMYIFQSASTEKKDKIAEIILSSVTPGDLMQGKILGYFVLGMLQALVYVAAGLAIAIWKLDSDVLKYLLAPETALYVAIAILGYLLFSALFVGIGATVADMSSASNFQGLVMALPFLPFIFMGPVLSNPEGIVAQIGTYIPFSAPGVLIMRLIMLDEWPWPQIIISLAILLVSIWVFMKLAGKIFKVGIMMYGKNATPKEILKWIRA